MSFFNTKVSGKNIPRKAFWFRVGATLHPNHPAWRKCPSIEHVDYQLELGKMGNPHWQCFVEGDKTMRYTAIAAQLGLTKGNWFAGTLKGKVDRIRMALYCQKLDTRVRGPYEYNRYTRPIYIDTSWFTTDKEGDQEAEKKMMSQLIENKLREIKWFQDFLDKDSKRIVEKTEVTMGHL